MQWYYSKNGTQLGPVPQDELVAKLGSGEVSSTELVWREGMPDWVAASQVTELRGIHAPPPISSGTPPSPYETPRANPTSPTPVIVVPPIGTGKATASMVLGIVSLVMGFLCGCLIGLPCGILAVVFGNQYKKAAESNSALLGELGKAKSGVLMGWIGIGISIVTTIIGVIINMGNNGFQLPQ